jgi:hypothetical protein
MRNRTTDITFPVFNGYTVRVILSHDLKATGRRLNADLDNAIAAHVPADPELPKRVWLIFGLEPDEATVAHEASHAVRSMLNYVGARTDNETFAYHLDYLVGRIHKFLKRAK